MYYYALEYTLLKWFCLINVTVKRNMHRSVLARVTVHCSLLAWLQFCSVFARVAELYNALARAAEFCSVFAGVVELCSVSYSHSASQCSLVCFEQIISTMHCVCMSHTELQCVNYSFTARCLLDFYWSLFA